MLGGTERHVYLQHWKLHRKPFENTPDPSFLYYSEAHRSSLDLLLYAARERKGMALLTGGHGCGKTLLGGAVVKALKPQEFVVGIVNNVRLSETELLNEILYQIGEDQQSERLLELSRLLGETLFRHVQQDKHTVLIVDDAHLIEDDGVLEQLRLLLNFQLEDRTMLTLVLMGLPGLRERVEAMPQLGQRLAVKCHVDPFGAEDVQNYVRHRLRIAGGQERVFADEAMREIAKATGGVPMRINTVCDLALMAGAKANAQCITPEIVTSVA